MTVIAPALSSDSSSPRPTTSLYTKFTHASDEGNLNLLLSYNFVTVYGQAMDLD